MFLAGQTSGCIRFMRYRSLVRIEEHGCAARNLALQNGSTLNWQPLVNNIPMQRLRSALL
jgi:hypothetical protein